MTTSLDKAVAVAGYYPALATTVLRTAIGAESVEAHFVHADTTFDAHEVRRHMTVLALTPTRLIRLHIDDGAPSDVPVGAHPPHEAAATVEMAPLRRVTHVALTYVVHHPENYQEGDLPSELVLAVGWGVHSRLELEPAGCGDENCDADHGYTGGITGDETLVRVSSIAEGADTVRALQAFADALNLSIGRIS